MNSVQCINMHTIIESFHLSGHTFRFHWTVQDLEVFLVYSYSCLAVEELNGLIYVYIVYLITKHPIPNSQPLFGSCPGSMAHSRKVSFGRDRGNEPKSVWEFRLPHPQINSKSPLLHDNLEYCLL